MRLAIAMGLLLALGCRAADALRFSSGTAQVALIELYTSEGCSSCPPADRWLGSLAGDPGLWTAFVPVGFHVDYWNGLGWRDRLSCPGFTARQRAYASKWGSRSVYTPCFVRNGSEWKPLFGSPGAPHGRAGRLSVEVEGGAACRVEYAPLGGAREAETGYEVHVALLGGGVSSKVTAGENEGSNLRHEFAVLAVASGLLSGDSGVPARRASIMMPRANLSGVGRRALAAWVTRRGDIMPLQATGGWLP
jgi:hypothetical protein